MKKSTIIFIELGTLLGIVVAGYTLPGNTSLKAFLIASGLCFTVVNILLVRKIKQIKEEGSSVKEGGPWPHLLRAFAILSICWLLSFLVHLLGAFFSSSR